MQKKSCQIEATSHEIMKKFFYFLFFKKSRFIYFDWAYRLSSPVNRVRERCLCSCAKLSVTCWYQMLVQVIVGPLRHFWPSLLDMSGLAVLFENFYRDWQIRFPFRPSFCRHPAKQQYLFFIHRVARLLSFFFVLQQVSLLSRYELLSILRPLSR